MTGPALSDRTRRILATLVRSYIETGEPVASAALAQKAGLNLSSATVRNVLAQLEEMGYVWQPHTSAGRVPTSTTSNPAFVIRSRHSASLPFQPQ